MRQWRRKRHFEGTNNDANSSMTGTKYTYRKVKICLFLTTQRKGPWNGVGVVVTFLSSNNHNLIQGLMRELGYLFVLSLKVEYFDEGKKKFNSL